MTCSLTLAPPGGLAFRADLLVQKDLQNKYFANPDGVKKLLDSFRLCLQLKDLNTTFEKSNKGSTGHTYLCSMPTYRITDEKKIQPMEFVLKWQNLAFCTIEKLGAQIFQHFGFHVPKIHQFSKSEATEVMHAAREMDFKLEAMVNGVPLIAMPKIHGGNLTDIIKNGKLKKLSKEDLEILLQKFGQIALLDLIIGNDDRFIGFSSNLKQVFHKSLNPGNVMVEVDQSSPPRLVGVYPIDNCTSADLILKEKEKEEEEMDLDLFSIFDEHEDLDAPMAVQSKSKEAHSAEIDPKCIAGFNAVF
nr:hypothetical protein [Chlamydiota bacterium]